MNATNATNTAANNDVEEALFNAYGDLVDDIRATTDLDRVKAGIYARMRAHTPALASVNETAGETHTAGGGERPLSEVRFLTVAEAAAMMRVSKMTVYRLVHNGELPAIKVRRSFRVPELAVRDYLRDAFDNWQVG
jgi:excisionase family DNA binding protein